jgi:hypothetical protein
MAGAFEHFFNSVFCGRYQRESVTPQLLYEQRGHFFRSFTIVFSGNRDSFFLSLVFAFGYNREFGQGGNNITYHSIYRFAILSFTASADWCGHSSYRQCCCSFTLGNYARKLYKRSIGK